MDPLNIPNEAFRHLKFFLERRQALAHEHSELSSLKSVFKSLEESLNSSIYFYKSQLEKTEFHNTNLIDSLLSIEKSLNSHIKEISSQLTEKSESEINLIQQVDVLNESIEAHLRIEKEYKAKALEDSEKIVILEGKVVEMTAGFLLERQKMIKEFIEEIGKLNAEIRKKEDLDALKLKEKEEIRHGAKDKPEKMKLFPVVEDEFLHEFFKENIRLKPKFEEITEKYARLESFTNELLKDIEQKGPEIMHYKQKYETLLQYSQDLSTRFSDYCNKSNPSEKTIFDLRNELKVSAQTISSLNSKISHLTNEVYNLTVENHKLLTGQSIKADKTKFVNCINDNIELYETLVKVSKESDEKSLRLNEKIKEIESLNKVYKESSAENGILKCRLDLLLNNPHTETSAIVLFREEALKFEIQEKESWNAFYKTQLEKGRIELLALNSQIADIQEEKKQLDQKILNLTQENFQLKLKQTSTNFQFAKITPALFTEKPIGCVLNCEEKIAELLQDKADSTSMIANLQQEAIAIKNSWAEEVTKLQAENAILRLLSNNSESNRITEDLGKARSSLREVQYLLNINEKELLEEKTKRNSLEIRMKKLRKALNSLDNKKMELAEFQSLKRKAEKSEAKIEELTKALNSLKDSITQKEKTFETSIESVHHALNKEKDSAEASQKNMKALLHSFNTLASKYEEKKQECSNLESYIEEKLAQSQRIQSVLANPNVQASEIHQICLILHQKLETLMGVQDMESLKSLRQIEELKNQIASLQTKLIQAEFLSNSLKNEIEAKKKLTEPEVLSKVVLLLSKAVKGSKVVKNN